MTGREDRMVERAEKRLEMRLQTTSLWRAMGDAKKAEVEERQARRDFAEAMLFAGLEIEV